MTEVRQCRHICREHCSHPPCENEFEADEADNSTSAAMCPVCRTLKWVQVCMDCSFDNGFKVQFEQTVAEQHLLDNPSHSLRTPKLVVP